MENKTSFKTINEFIYQSNKEFEVPNYQRGFKWAVRYSDKDGAERPSAVEKLLDDLLKAWRTNKNQPYFLQGVTVCEKENKIILIDGQQRTTTLYLLLWRLGREYIDNIALVYDIRAESRVFISNLKEEGFDYSSYDSQNEHQDIFYFKEAIKQIESKILDIDKSDFVDFLLNKVTILYIVIDQDKAIKTFTMMNGSKATMLQEELVKAEMLRKVSIPENEERVISSSVDDNLLELREIISKDWETNALRSRYAREWDKWLYWWNREDVKKFFGIENPMGLLLRYYYQRTPEYKKQNFNFENFRALILDKRQTMEHFKGLRDLQKAFEDIYNDAQIYNYLGIALINGNRFEVIDFFVHNKDNIDLLRIYARLKLIGVPDHQIIKSQEQRDDNNKVRSIAIDFSRAIADKFAYHNSYENISKYLLLLNIEEDNKLDRKFDFRIWANRSLEHIFPKSKVYFSKVENGVKLWYRGDGEILSKNEKYEIGAEIGKVRNKELETSRREWINRSCLGDGISEHSLGNLVLLYGRNNSTFGNKSFNSKKNSYFDLTVKFDSRHLLHTISVFANEKWQGTEIKCNFEKAIKQFEIDFGVKLEDDK